MFRLKAQNDHLQVSLQEGCKKILVSDCYSLLTRKVRTASRGEIGPDDLQLVLVSWLSLPHWSMTNSCRLVGDQRDMLLWVW